MAVQRWDPNPNRGKVSLFDGVTSILFALVKLPFVLSRVLLRRAFYRSVLTFKTDCLRSLVRSGSESLALSVKRKILNVNDTSDITESNRFKGVASSLLEELVEEKFTGYWICQGPPAKCMRPDECDLVVLYFHGGAYVLGHPLMDAVWLLRVAEIAAEQGVSIAILSVNYSLAPEAVFPKQQEQAIAAYKYLLDRLSIQPSRIVVAGQSAGGHLALCLLNILKLQSLPIPGSAWLMCPWLDLTNSAASIQRNAFLDTLNKTSLDHARDALICGNKTAVVNFAELDDLATILPQITYVSIGEYDMLVDGVASFVARARKQGADVILKVHPTGTHAWEAMEDYQDRKPYLALDPGRPATGLMKGAQSLANGLISIAAFER